MKSTYTILLALMAGCTAGDDLHAPMIDSVSPSHASPGTSVTIAGNYFCQQEDTGGVEEDPLACANTGTVSFGLTPGTVGMYTEQVVSAEVPALLQGSYPVSISVAGRQSNRVTLVVDAP